MDVVAALADLWREWELPAQFGPAARPPIAARAASSADGVTAMTASLPLGAGPEFDRIREIARVLGRRRRAARRRLRPAAGGRRDSRAQHGHERRRRTLPARMAALEEIGWRAAAAALSDLAAERPRRRRAPGRLTVRRATRARTTRGGHGRRRAPRPRRRAALVLGGDLSRGRAWSVAVTVIGRAARAAHPRGRGARRPALGDRRARCGARRPRGWQRGEPPAPEARRAFARPEPRIAAGMWLAGMGAPRCST